MIRENRTVNGKRVETIRIFLDAPQDLIDQYKQDGFTEFLECYLVLYKPPEAEVLKEKLDSIAADLPDEIAVEHPEIYGELRNSGELVPTNKRINWNGVVMKAKVDLWDRLDQNPDNAPELWDELLFSDTNYREIPEIITTELAFGKDEIGYWPKNGKHYKAKRDGVVHNPEVYPADWDEVTVSLKTTQSPARKGGLFY